MVLKLEMAAWSAHSNNAYKAKGISLVLVGDDAIYADGSTAKIVSGAGTAFMVNGQSAALVGSPLENGDEIIDSLIMSHVFRLYHDQRPPMLGGSKDA